MFSRRLYLATIAVVAILGMSATIADELGDERYDGSDWLAQGFKGNDSKPLIRFLEGWRTSNPPITDGVLAKKPEFEREAYAVFRAFFVPSKDDLVHSYLIIQKDLMVTLADNDFSDVFAKRGDFGTADRLRQLATISRVTLNDFRPPVAVKGPKVLYLTRDHLRELLTFLVAEPENEFHDTPLVDRYWDIEHGARPHLEEDTETDPQVLKSRKQRLDYLNTHLGIIPGHWENGWIFETEPQANHLYLNKDRTRAIIEFEQVYGGGEVYLKKTDKGDWKVIERDRNWTE